MKIKTLSIQNFRNIAEKTSYKFNPNFTVVIGQNGSGKSTILQALRIACSGFFLAIPDVKSRHIEENEIRVLDHGKLLVSQRPVVISVDSIVEDKFGHDVELTWQRKINSASNKTSSAESDVGVIRKHGLDKYTQIQSGNDQVSLPLIAYFGTSRVFGAGKVSTARIGRQIFKDGYANWHEMKSSTYKYNDWLASYDLLREEDKEYFGTKDAFFTALKTANRYILDVRFVANELWLKIKFDDFISDFLPLHLHSDGIIAFTEMVAEIAYRCVVLNGYLAEESIIKTKGVVMIDELDIHLHPNWQKVVIEDLKVAFPNLQFVATTHSPFIVQSLNSNELINLDRISDVNFSDLSLGDVATNIMGVNSNFSKQNELKYQQAKEILQDIKSGKNECIANEIEKISDPALRAFLELNRLAKGK